MVVIHYAEPLAKNLPIALPVEVEVVEDGLSAVDHAITDDPHLIRVTLADVLAPVKVP